MVGVYSYVDGTTLPEAYSLKAASAKPAEIDPVLNDWYKTYTESVNPLDLKPEEYKKTTRKFWPNRQSIFGLAVSELQ